MDAPLPKWKLPIIRKGDVYSDLQHFICIFGLRSMDRVVMKERSVPIGCDEATISILLVEPDEFEEILKKYSFVHLGMVQVGITPQPRRGLNTSVVSSTLDCRHNSFSDTLIAAVHIQ